MLRIGVDLGGTKIEIVALDAKLDSAKGRLLLESGADRIVGLYGTPLTGWRGCQ